MTGPARPEASRFRDGLRTLLLVLLVAAPLAFGSVHAPAYIPLLVAATVLGLLSWARGHWARVHGSDVPLIPARRVLLLVHLLVLLQLVPLPPRVLRMLSPGSFDFYDYASLVPLASWRPISVSPADTARGLVFLAGMSLLYSAAFREFRDPRWRRRVVLTIVGTGVFMTLEALFQAASGRPTTIYGFWQPRWDWGVFGPYVNKNHFAGYMAMAVPLGLGLVVEAFQEVAHWSRRRSWWLSLGEGPGSVMAQRSAATLVLIVGLLASRSRGGLVAFTASVSAFAFVQRSRKQVLVLVLLLAALGPGFVSVDHMVHSMGRGQDPRLEVWPDALRVVRHFPVFGAGFNAFGTSYASYQQAWRGVWFGEAHNEYLQSLVDMGLLGAALTLTLVGRLLKNAYRPAAASGISAGLFASLVAAAVHNLVEFNWQIPANAATFGVLAGLAMQEPGHTDAGLDPPQGRA